MKKNIGITDRIIRFVVIDVLLGLSFLGQDIPPYLATAAFIISILLAITIIIAYSPIYHVIGISTIEESNKETPDSAE
jgi:hypothetical protein